MNNKYMILDDGSVEVALENGKIEKRIFNEKKYLNDILMFENKVEMLDKEINSLNKKVREEERTLFFCQKMRYAYPIMILMGTVGGFFLGADIIPYGIHPGLQGLILGTTMSLVPVIGGKITRANSTKKICGFQNAVEKANQMKEQYKTELSMLQQKKNVELESNDKINNSVSLINQNELAHLEIEKELNQVYETTVNNNSKKLVLKRKNN